MRALPLRTKPGGPTIPIAGGSPPGPEHSCKWCSQVFGWELAFCEHWGPFFRKAEDQCQCVPASRLQTPPTPSGDRRRCLAKLRAVLAIGDAIRYWGVIGRGARESKFKAADREPPFNGGRRPSCDTLPAIGYQHSPLPNSGALGAETETGADTFLRPVVFSPVMVCDRSKRRTHAALGFAASTSRY